MDRITDNQHQDIRTALQDVFDTFCDTNIFVHLRRSVASDSMEDYSNNTYTTKILKGFVEYPDNNLKETLEGAVDNSEIKIMLGLDDCQTAGLIDDTMPIIEKKRDCMTVNGIRYLISDVIVSGAFTKKNIVVYLFGNKTENFDAGINDSVEWELQNGNLPYITQQEAIQDWNNSL